MVHELVEERHDHTRVVDAEPAHDRAEVLGHDERLLLLGLHLGLVLGLALGVKERLVAAALLGEAPLDGVDLVEGEAADVRVLLGDAAHLEDGGVELARVGHARGRLRGDEVAACLKVRAHAQKHLLHLCVGEGGRHGQRRLVDKAAQAVRRHKELAIGARHEGLHLMEVMLDYVVVLKQARLALAELLLDALRVHGASRRGGVHLRYVGHAARQRRRVCERCARVRCASQSHRRLQSAHRHGAMGPRGVNAQIFAISSREVRRHTTMRVLRELHAMGAIEERHAHHNDGDKTYYLHSRI